MKRYLINGEVSQQWLKSLLSSQKERSQYNRMVHESLGCKVIGDLNFIVGTNRIFWVVECLDDASEEALHVYLHSGNAISGVRYTAVEQIISFSENSELYQKHAHHLTHFKMPGDE